MSREDLILIGTVIVAFVIGYAVVSVIIAFIKTPRFKPEDEQAKPLEEGELPLLEDPTRDPKYTSSGYGDRYGARQPPRQE
ncbi:MAG: hypothetical protein ABFD69_17185 [Candidatus Sumerlaeia bacterium]